MFKRQCYLTAWYDRASLRTRHHIGTGNILWATNFPLGTTTWPQTQDYISRCFEDVPEEERRAMFWDNAAEVYGLQQSRLQEGRSS
jgi:predicted TIM-barrel fold metal-dependent hydrolase